MKGAEGRVNKIPGESVIRFEIKKARVAIKKRLNQGRRKKKVPFSL